VGGVPYREIAKRYSASEGDVPVVVSIAALSRHNAAHVSPALQRVQAAREAQGVTSLLDRTEELYKVARHLLSASIRDGKAGVSLQAVRELRAVVELLGKITGELRDSPQTVLNVLADPEWLRLRATIMEALSRYPDARFAVADRLAALESGDDA
jgi:hypothetical protein